MWVTWFYTGKISMCLTYFKSCPDQRWGKAWNIACQFHARSGGETEGHYHRAWRGQWWSGCKLCLGSVGESWPCCSSLTYYWSKSTILCLCWGWQITPTGGENKSHWSNSTHVHPCPVGVPTPEHSAISPVHPFCSKQEVLHQDVAADQNKTLPASFPHWYPQMYSGKHLLNRVGQLTTQMAWELI